jgi:MoxR-like ATPase
VPGIEELAEIVARTTGEPLAPITPRFAAAEVDGALGLIRQVKIADAPLRFALRIVRATHPDGHEAPACVRRYVRYGASPRAAQAMILGAKALALLAGRFNVSVADVRRVAEPALIHRVILNFRAEMDHAAASSLIEDVLAAAGEG